MLQSQLHLQCGRKSGERRLRGSRAEWGKQHWLAWPSLVGRAVDKHTRQRHSDMARQAAMLRKLL